MITITITIIVVVIIITIIVIVRVIIRIVIVIIVVIITTTIINKYTGAGEVLTPLMLACFVIHASLCRLCYQIRYRMFVRLCYQIQKATKEVLVELPGRALSLAVLSLR